MDFKEIITAIQTQVGADADGVAGRNTWKAIYKNILGQDAGTDDICSLVSAVQQAVGVSVDGNPGTNTWNAIAAKLGAENNTTNDNPAPAGDDDTGKVDDRSETTICALLPEVQQLARLLVHKAADAGITIKVISGLRTYDEQDALYAKGRTEPGGIVTNAKGGFSNHNFGLAFDIGVFEGNNYLDESPKYKTVGAIGESIGLTWGGSWTTIQDEPHFELRPGWAKDLSEGNMLAALRDRKENGQSFFA